MTVNPTTTAISAAWLPTNGCYTKVIMDNSETLTAGSCRRKEKAR